MIMKDLKRVLLAGLLLLGFSSNGMALSIPPPFAGLAPDINGNGLFRPVGPEAIVFEIFDILDNVPAPSGSEFGFYFANDPASLFAIFEDDDLSSATGPVLGEAALVDFSRGWITDQESAEVDLFTPQAATDIGFYWRQTIPGGITLRTQASLNDGGTDAAAEFPYLSNPMTWAIVFGIPLPNGSASLLGIQAVDPLMPSPIPLPGAAGLWMLGLAGIALFRRRLNRPAV